MADTNANAAAPRKRRGWLRILLGIAVLFVLVVVVGYFVLTSSAFFKGTILPKVSKAINAQVTVGEASISPFSQVVLRDLKVQTTGTEPLLTAPEVRLRYSLMDIIGGHINVDEVTVASPIVVLVQNPDGTSNLDPILQSQKKTEQPSKPTSSKPPQVNVKKIALTDATVRQIKMYKGANNRDLTEVSHLNIEADNLQNGQSAKLTLAAQIKIEQNPPAPATSGGLEAKANGNFTVALTADLKPASIQGNTRLEVSRAEGALAQASAFSANLDCDVSPTDIKQVALKFQKGGTPLGELNVSGPFNLEKTEGQITIQLLDVDKNLLNLAGASSGLDFGPTTVNSTNTLQLSNAGNTIAASGQLNLRQFQLTRTNQTTPALDLAANYDVAIDRTAGNAQVRTFHVTGTQKGNQLLKGDLTSPMSFSWGNANNAVGDSSLNLALSHLDLANWKPFVGDFAPAGDVNLKLQLLSQQAGKQLSFELNSEINNLTAGSGSNQITQAGVTLQVKGKAEDLKQFQLSDYRLGISRQNQSLMTISGSGSYDKANEAADLQLKGQVLLARLIQAMPRSEFKADSGTIDLAAHVLKKGAQQQVSGNLAITDLSAQFGSTVFQNFGAASDFDIGMSPDRVQIRKLAGSLAQGKNAGGTFDLSGTYGLSNKTAQLSAKLTEFNQNGLRPFLEPMLTGKKLTSVALNGTASVQYDPNAASSIKADLQVTNLVVKDPKGQFPEAPLAATCQVDTTLNKQVADIRQCQLALTPTARATNVISLTGRLDMSQTNAMQGNLKIAADSLDLTTYYNLFAGQEKAAAAAHAPEPRPASSPVAASTANGLQTNQLPFRNFSTEAAVRRLYLGEVDIANFQSGTKIDGGRVLLNPFKLTVNGAPVDANIDVDLAVPGYKYAVEFNAQTVPLTPLVNTFQPERKGQLGGTFTAQGKISGTGTEGPSLQKTLSGQFDIASTNLNLSVINIKNPIMRTVINVVATVPDLVKNPGGAAGSLLQGLTGQTQGGGLSDELSKSPINSIIARGNAGGGKINLQQATIESSAFRADATGTITLAPVLTNSTIQIPVAISLSQPIARKVNLVSADTPTNAPYAKLPDFLTLTGTLGDPKHQENKLALVSLAAKALGGAGIGGTAGNLIQGLSNLGGKAGTNTTTQSTNKVNNVLQGLGALLGGEPPTAKPPASTNQPPANQQQPLNNLLNDLLNKSNKK